MQRWFHCTVCTVTVYLAGPTSYADGGGAAYLFWFLHCCCSLRLASLHFNLTSANEASKFFPSTSCNIVNVNPSAGPCANTSTWACKRVDFQNVASALPPLGLHGGNSGFPVQHLTLCCCLRLVRHYKETLPPPLIPSGYHRDERVRNTRAVGLDLNSVAVETPRGPNIGWGGSAAGRGVGFHCHIFEELPMGSGGKKTGLDLKKKQWRGRAGRAGENE